MIRSDINDPSFECLDSDKEINADKVKEATSVKISNDP